jgi:hypothetical protein
MGSKRKLAPGLIPFTWRKLAAAGAIAACVPAAAALALHPVDGGNIEWSIQRDGSSADASNVQLTIETRWGAGNHSIWSEDRPISQLQGLNPAQVTGATGPVRFALARDAGRLDCSGTAGALTWHGACSFVVDPRFVADLQERGIGAPTPRQAFALTMSGVGRDLIDAMQSIGYAKPTVEQLSNLAIHGVSAGFVRGLAESGYRLQSADDLVDFKIHGVDLDYIRAVAASGPRLQHLSADELVNLRIHGARPELVRAYAAYTRGALSADDVVDLAIHGVTPAFLQELAALGYRNFSADDLVNLSIHGVTADYVRRLRGAGMTAVPAEQLVRLRLAGFEPQ